MARYLASGAIDVHEFVDAGTLEKVKAYFEKHPERIILILDIREYSVRKTGQFTHVSSIFRHDVRGKRFITHGGRNPRYKYLGCGIFQFADSVLSLPVK